MVVVEGNLLLAHVPVKISGPLGFPTPHSPHSVTFSFAPLSTHRRNGLVAKKTPKPIVCLLGGIDRPKDDNKGLLWKPLQKVLGSFTGRSVEDVLREQIADRKFYDGGSGGKPPIGGAGGGGSGESDNESNVEFLDEAVKVMLATMGFLFMYFYIICGPELTRLVRDYIKFLNGGGQSVRLKKAISWWSSLYYFLTRRKKMDDMWLENQTMETATWFDSPEMMKSDFAASGNGV